MVQEAIKIEKLESNDYILTFDVNEFYENIDGHKWAVLIKSHMTNEGVELEGVNHDPESDFYYATAPSIESLNIIASVIQAVASDQCLRDVPRDGASAPDNGLTEALGGRGRDFEKLSGDKRTGCRSTRREARDEQAQETQDPVRPSFRAGTQGGRRGSRRAAAAPE